MAESKVDPLLIDGNELQAIVSAPSRQLQHTGASSMGLVERALDRGCDLATIEKMMELQERYERNEARKAYDHAFAAFKAESVKIVKNITVTAGPLNGKKYADLFAVVSATTPALSKYGLSSFWKLTKDEPGWMEVTCILRHELGHSETVAMGGKPDIGGAKNDIQARASTKSYLERYTFLAITGQAASGEDTDGVVLSGEMKDLLDIIKGSATKTELHAAFTEAYKTAKDTKTKSVYLDAYEARKKELA
jgi:hypothetical protein